MRSGGHASRSFKHNEGNLKGMQGLPSAAHYAYHSRVMTKEEFMRVSRLPGMREFFQQNEMQQAAGVAPSVPWHMYGKEKYK
jgi:hypothetical protein